MLNKNENWTVAFGTLLPDVFLRLVETNPDGLNNSIPKSGTDSVKIQLEPLK